MQRRREFLTSAVASIVSALCASAPLRAQPREFRGVRAGAARAIDGIDFRWCPSGRFTMGSPPSEVGRRADEAQVEVTLTRGFWSGSTEVTQSQWRRVVGDFPDKPPTEQFGMGDAHPAYWISFLEAEDFCARMTQRAHRDGSLPDGWEIRLPTEAQWEYLCRAGTRSASAFGASLTSREANVGYEPPARGQPSPGRTTPVGSFRANAWGIHDAHGNVWEWCRDYYHARLPGGVDPDLHDVPGVRNGDGTYSRVRRGGAFIEPLWACRSATRLRYEPPRRSDHIGFRVVAVER